MFIVTHYLLSIQLFVFSSLQFPCNNYAYSLFDFRRDKSSSKDKEEWKKTSLSQQSHHIEWDRNDNLSPQQQQQHRRRREIENEISGGLVTNERKSNQDGRNNKARDNNAANHHSNHNRSFFFEESTLSTGLFHTCAIVHRTGMNTDDACGDKSVSSSSFSTSSSCGPARCWGQNNFGQSSPPPGVVFRQLSSGGFFTCGLKVDGSVACWGDIDHPPKSLELLSSEERSNVEHARKMRQNEEGQRRGYGGNWPVNGGGYHNIQISSGLKHACAISLDSEVHCWGRNDYGESNPPHGSFIQVSAGHSFTCGIRSNGAVKCWGKNDVDQSSPPPYPKYAFQQVSASVAGDHACGVLLDSGAIRCWGNNSRGQSEPQDGNFLQVSAGARTTCAIRIDNANDAVMNHHYEGSASSSAIHCWGSRANTLLDHFNIEQRTIKAGNNNVIKHQLSQISLGQDHACAHAKTTTEAVDGLSEATRSSLQCWWMAGTDFDAHRVPVGLEMVA